MARTQIVIHGAAGRMGQRLIALAAQDRELEVVGALDWHEHPRLGDDAGMIAGIGPIGVPLSATLDVDADVVIDFSLPAGTSAIVPVCVAKKLPLVVATTALAEEQTSAIREAAGTVPILWAPNMSLAVNLAIKLAEYAAGALKDQDADVEILERHHRFKEDAPSGTALKFGETIAAVMGQNSHRHGRQGRAGARPHGEIGYHAIRTGDNPGEHTIIFGMLGETIEVTVRATSRDCYAAGALAGAKFLVDKRPGLYDMNDLLGL